MKNRTNFICLLLVLSIVACKKKKDVDTFIFYNTASENVTADLYTNTYNYYHCVNAVKTIHLTPGENKINLEDLGEGTQYFIDYYNQDCSYTNWRQIPGSVYDDNDNYYIHFTATKSGKFQLGEFNYFNYPILYRKTLINGKEAKMWKAVDAYRLQPFTRIWDTLSDNRKYKTLSCGVSVFELTEKDNSGALQSTQFDNNNNGVKSVNKIGVFKWLLYGDNLHDCYIYNVSKPLNIFPDDSKAYDYSPSNDTICVILNSTYEYFMVKQ